mmetsp:Transcript_86139/g.278765  ORF Transcript_86139/g.278765 Transcript_86139/m.278765 type:complete len:238 (+) Transcript_86139:53-766(+)
MCAGWGDEQKPVFGPSERGATEQPAAAETGGDHTTGPGADGCCSVRRSVQAPSLECRRLLAQPTPVRRRLARSQSLASPARPLKPLPPLRDRPHEQPAATGLPVLLRAEVCAGPPARALRRRFSRPSLAVAPPPQKAEGWGDLDGECQREFTFRLFCDGRQDMHRAGFRKLCRYCFLLDSAFTAADADRVFNSAAQEGRQHLDAAEFERALGLVAECKGVEAASVLQAVASPPGPML